MPIYSHRANWMPIHSHRASWMPIHSHRANWMPVLLLTRVSSIYGKIAASQFLIFYFFLRINQPMVKKSTYMPRHIMIYLDFQLATSNYFYT